MYFTDRGLEELEERRGQDRVTLGWLAERLREFIDLHPDAESPVDALASWLARLDDDSDGLDDLVDLNKLNKLDAADALDEE
jgi:Family of unknown function (DUF6104)